MIRRHKGQSRRSGLKISNGAVTLPPRDDYTTADGGDKHDRLASLKYGPRRRRSFLHWTTRGHETLLAALKLGKDSVKMAAAVNAISRGTTSARPAGGSQTNRRRTGRQSHAGERASASSDTRTIASPADPAGDDRHLFRADRTRKDPASCGGRPRPPLTFAAARVYSPGGRR